MLNQHLKKIQQKKGAHCRLLVGHIEEMMSLLLMVNVDHRFWHMMAVLPKKTTTGNTLIKHSEIFHEDPH